MNITLVTDVLPDDNYTAGQVLRRTLQRLNASVEVVWINQSMLPEAPSTSLFRVVRQYRFTPPLRGFLHSVTMKLGPSSRSVLLLQAILTAWLCVRIGASAALVCRRSQPTYIWLCLQGEKLLLVYCLLAFFGRRPIILQQWDPLSWWMYNRGHRPIVIRLLSYLVRWLQRKALLNLVPSVTWAALLREQGCHALRLDNFFAAGEELPSSFMRVHTPGAVNAVFLGQSYAGSELRECVALLARNARALGCRVVLHCFGQENCLSWPNVEVVQHGYRLREELVSIIGKWDVALLPYPTEARFAETARLSFPSKSRVYIAAALPILAWAPETSSVHEFLSTHYRDYYVNAYSQEDLTEFLQACRRCSPATVRRRQIAARSIVDDWFSERAEFAAVAHKLSEWGGANDRHND